MADSKNNGSGRNNYELKNFYSLIMRQQALLYKYQFFVQLYTTDDLGWNSAAGENFSYYVQSASIPGTKLVNGKTVFFGTEFRIPGVKQWDHNWQTEILIDEDLKIYKKLELWREAISSLNKNGGGIKSIPHYQAEVSILSTDHQTTVETYVLEGVWLKSLGDISLAYQNNGGGDVLKIPAEFRYQYVYRKYDGDPLDASKKSS